MLPPSASELPVVSPFSSGGLDEFISRPTPGVIAALGHIPTPILVLGAGGKMGIHLSGMLHRGLVAAGKKPEVLAVSRFGTLRSRDDFSMAGVDTLACDLERPEEVAGLPDAGTIFYLAGIKFGTSSAPDLLRRLNVR